MNSAKLINKFVGTKTFNRLFFDDYHGVFDHHKCVFIHIPKAAGSSVALSLFGHHVMHKTAAQRHLDNPKKFNQYYKFTFVRNPWDRLASAYFFLKKGGMNHKDKAWADLHLSQFDDFSTFVKTWVNPRNVLLKNHFTPQYLYLNNGNPDSRTVIVDFVGKLESIDDGFRHVCKTLNIDATLATTNKSDHAHYRTYYDEESIEIVRDVYKVDVELFDYKF